MQRGADGSRLSARWGPRRAECPGSGMHAGRPLDRSNEGGVGKQTNRGNGPRGAASRKLAAQGGLPERSTFVGWGVLLLGLGLGVGACGDGATEPGADAEGGYRVVETLPHDTTAFTQGLLLHGGLLYESTGLRGESTLREVEPETGRVLRRVALDSDLFGEGLALVGDRLIQLTWTSGRAFAYDRASFEVLDTFTYEGEGWGLCFDGEALVQSRGDAVLLRRDPDTFALVDSVEVVHPDGDVGSLNELECVGGEVWANVWPTDRILRIDGADGHVIADLDFSGLVPSGEPEEAYRGVLNGIAHDSASDTWLLTGKRWPTIFRVRLEGG